jgi:hypothetical protein
MADKLATFESTLADIRQAAIARKQPPRMAAAQEDNPMADSKTGFWAWISGKGAPDEGDAPPTIEPRALAPDETFQGADLPAGSTARVVSNPFADRLAELETQLETQQAQARQAQAAAFADGAVRARQAYPSERQALYDAYIQAAEDDAARPIATTRISQVEALIGSRTPHSLTEELIATNTAGALPSGATPQAMTEERRASLLAMTPAGQAALERRQRRSA